MEWKGLKDLITGKMVLASLMIGLLYWIIEPALLHTDNFVNAILSPESHEFWMRFMVITSLFVFGEIAQYAINVRRQVEEFLQESEQRLDAILNTIQTGIFIIDPKTHIIVDVNPVAVKMIGSSKEKIIGSRCFDYICTAKEGQCPITDLLQKVDNSEHALLRVNREKLPIIKTATTVMLKGKEHILESSIDITERKKAEEELKRANIELRKADKIKMQFLNIVSHELRTPLTPMIAQLQMILYGYFGELTEKQKKSLEMVLRNTVRLDRLIEDILDISKLESGMMKFNMDRANLNEIVKNAVEMMRAEAENKNIRLMLREEKIPEIVLDKDRITQVVVNLINNAIKFTDSGGSVEVELVDGENWATVKVRDSGIGIKKEDQEKIFRPFVQVDSSMTREYGGSGLGLAICKGIIEYHGGKIWVESEPEEGSTFTFTIPYNYKVRKDVTPDLFGVGAEKVS